MPFASLRYANITKPFTSVLVLAYRAVGYIEFRSQIALTGPCIAKLVIHHVSDPLHVEPEPGLNVLGEDISDGFCAHVGCFNGLDAGIY